MKCTECHSPMRVERTEETVRVAGRQFVGDLPALRCANGHVLIDGPGLEQFEREIAQHLARDRASADAFRFIRKANGLPAKTVAELFDVTPETVSRWESGALSLPRLAWATLLTLTAGPHETAAETIRRALTSARNFGEAGVPVRIRIVQGGPAVRDVPRRTEAKVPGRPRRAPASRKRRA